MDNDRALLIAAARAAGYEFGYINDELHIMVPGGCGTYGCTKLHPRKWNPRDDDGDAFRLAVTLGIDLALRSTDTVSAWCQAERDFMDELHGTDKAAAARKAIVRAAAAMAPPPHAWMEEDN